MKYIDSGIREAEQTVAFWMREVAGSGIYEFRCQAGYFTLEGLGILLPSLKACAEQGSVVKVLLGSNGGVTLASHVAFLAGTLGVPQKHVSLGIVGFENSLFHPKVYHFVRNDGSQTAYVGSANLTGSGISGMNIEAGVILDTKEGDDASELSKMATMVEYWFDNNVLGLSFISGAEDIDSLLATGRLALRPVARTPKESGAEEGGLMTTADAAPGSRLISIFQMPAVTESTSPATPFASRRVAQHAYRYTEASFHYPQGTHLGHILSLLWYFSKDRAGTPFGDDFIRLSGSLGAGRIAAYRRQVKYKLLAAMELGLLTDIRLEDDITKYVPKLTEEGASLWGLIAPIVDTNDLIFGTDPADEYSTKTVLSPGQYNELIIQAQSDSANFLKLYQSAFLNMPAVMQMLKLLYHQEQSRVVKKSKICQTFFDSRPVQDFCDEMGIEPATEESARHRCPFLLNILESCGVLTQRKNDVVVNKLALSTSLLTTDELSSEDAEKVLQTIIEDWNGEKSTLPEKVQRMLRKQFGKLFLTKEYHINQAFKVPR